MSEREWDSADSARFQDRVEAGEIDQHGEPRQAGLDEWGLPVTEAEAGG
jgi:hypothetical protein